MKKILYFVAVLSAFLTSCTSENEFIENNPTKGTSTITATFDQPATRVQMDESDGTNTPLQWNAGDQLVVYNVTSDNFGVYQTASSVSDGDASATFEYKGMGFEIVSAEPHFALYPYEKIDDTDLSFEYQTEQTYTENSFDPAAMPMVASNASGTAFNNFTAQAAVLRLKVSTTASDVAVNSIDITSASMALTGYAAPDMGNGTYGVPTTGTGKKVTLNCTTPVAINGTAKDFNIVVPGQTYPSGDLTITVKTNKGDFEKTSKAEATFAAGKVYNLNISGVPAPAPATTGSAAATGIGDVNWVQLWAGGPKFAEKNIGATNVTDQGSELNFSQATAEGVDYEWGSLWCTPSKDDMEHLMTAAKGQTDDKVTCAYTQENSVWGFKFTGKTAGYESNSVFFPAQDGHSSDGYAYYWSGTASGDEGWIMILNYDEGDWLSGWDDTLLGVSCFVRPVLK